MRSEIIAVLAAFATQRVAAHATFQDFWINGVDQGSTCARLPASNSPVTDVTSTTFRCNGISTASSTTCSVKAGDVVTVEMHQQPGDRSCANEAIGGAHYGPVTVYMTKVDNAATADGSTGWFKIFQDGWAHNSAGASGDDDFWGTKDLNTCCGKMNVKIPTDIASGDYLLRAEALALHTASSSGGAQFYMTCFQINVSGSGSASPSTVKFPGAYAASDPGILINIHQSLSTYVVPGPTVYSGGSTKSAGATCSGAESTGVTSATTLSTTTAATSTKTTSTTSAGNTAGCTAAKYAQCGGTGFTGCTTCASGSTCSAISPPYYSQCV